MAADNFSARNYCILGRRESSRATALRISDHKVEYVNYDDVIYEEIIEDDDIKHSSSMVKNGHKQDNGPILTTDIQDDDTSDMRSLLRKELVKYRIDQSTDAGKPGKNM